MVYSLAQPTSDWVQHVHLDGKPYFIDSSRNIVTEANVMDQNVTKRIDSLYNALQELWTSVPVDKCPQVDDKYELYLSVSIDSDNFYYYINHTTQDIFWLTDI